MNKYFKVSTILLVTLIMLLFLGSFGSAAEQKEFTLVIRMKAKKDIEENKIGDLIYIYTISEYGKNPSLIKGFDTNWLFNPQKSGGGGFADTAPHGIDSLRWLINSEVKAVYADIGNKIFPNLDVDDIGTVIIEFKNGVIGVLGAGWANPESYPTWLDIRYEMLGTKGF
ncbi:unnamed protein product, partial [marine sediment metagenome]